LSFTCSNIWGVFFGFAYAYFFHSSISISKNLTIVTAVTKPNTTSASITFILF
jgi:hypothetical protein